MINVFAGYDDREAVGYHTFCASLIRNASQPLSITPLHLDNLRGIYSEVHKDGTNAFIYSRFLVPYLMGYKGWAIFVDGADMVCKGDIAELWAMRDYFKAVQVVGHDYKTKHPRKYVGTSIEADNGDYPCKNWSSVMLINCGHKAWQGITPTGIEGMTGAQLHRFSFMKESEIGFLRPEWNWLADEFGENPNAKLLHYTAGIPAWEHYKDTPHAADWFEANKWVNHAA